MAGVDSAEGGGGKVDIEHAAGAGALSGIQSLSPAFDTPGPGSSYEGTATTLKAKSRAYVEQTQADLEGVLATLRASTGDDYYYDKSKGVVYKLVPKSSGSEGKAFLQSSGASASTSGGDLVPVEVSGEVAVLARRRFAAEQADAQLSKDIGDKLIEFTGGQGGGGGTIDAAKAYRDSEALKTKEITRQYNDFADRADELYQLLKNEQGLFDAEGKANADAASQNIKNLDATQKLSTGLPAYGYITLGNEPAGIAAIRQRPLSSILAPSLPDYVRPDYRMNAAVGLPGAEGFDNPNYSSAGFPLPQQASSAPEWDSTTQSWLDPVSGQHWNRDTGWGFAFGTDRHSGFDMVTLDPRYRIKVPIGALPWEKGAEDGSR